MRPHTSREVETTTLGLRNSITVLTSPADPQIDRLSRTKESRQGRRRRVPGGAHRLAQSESAISCTNHLASSTAASSGCNTFTATLRLCLRSSARWGRKIRTDARYREKASRLPGGLKPGLGPLRGRVLKDKRFQNAECRLQISDCPSTPRWVVAGRQSAI